MKLFLDSSALAKRYIEEPNSEVVLARCEQAEEIILSVLCIPELLSGFNRLKREKKLTPGQYLKLKSSLAGDVNEATIIEVSPAVIREAIFCLEKGTLRTLDALQVGSAVESLCDLFLTADQRQSEIAKIRKLEVEFISTD